mgnify:CR=1 FL=1
MAIIKSRPLTPSQRFLELGRNEVDNKRPERSLTESKQRAKGRNCYGRITSRRRGGGHKKLYRIVDFKRDIVDVPATVVAIEYDPNRSAYLALLNYENGQKRYIIAPDGLKKGAADEGCANSPRRGCRRAACCNRRREGHGKDAQRRASHIQC